MRDTTWKNNFETVNSDIFFRVKPIVSLNKFLFFYA